MARLPRGIADWGGLLIQPVPIAMARRSSNKRGQTTNDQCGTSALVARRDEQSSAGSDIPRATSGPDHRPSQTGARLPERFGTRAKTTPLQGSGKPPGDEAKSSPAEIDGKILSDVASS